MRDLRVSLIQRELHWEDPAANRAQFESDIASCGETDLVILPEMFSTGFSMDVDKNAEPDDGPSRLWLQAQAQRFQCAVTGSLPIRTDAGIFNRLYFATPEGDLHRYDKRHLFRMSAEHEHYQAGTERMVLEWRGWRICPLICYDLRFPVWSRNREDYDLLLYVANWPQKRRHHWRSLLLARAIENQAYTVGVNRTGIDGHGLHYSGDSLAFAADGEVLFDCMNKNGVHTTVLDAARLELYRRKFPCALDADDFQLD